VGLVSDLDDSMARHPAGRKLPWADKPYRTLDPTDWQVYEALEGAGFARSALRRDIFRAGMLYAIEAMRAARPR
jgi:hypothetical protein